MGTEGSEIWEIDSSKKATCLMRGHYGDETWGLAVHPQEIKYASCGGDKRIRIW